MPSFDIVSEVNLQEVDNAIHQAMKEISTRYDFKGSKAEIKRTDKVIDLLADDDYKLKAVVDVLQGKLAKRGVPLNNLDYGKAEPGPGGTMKQKITVVVGIPQDKAKTIVKAIKDSKLKVQPAIQGDAVRVSGKSKDELQEAIALVRSQDFGLALQFINYRD